MRTLSVMDHWFQMEMLWPAEEPMLKGYTALLCRGEDGAAPVPAPRRWGHLPASRAVGQDRDDPRRPVGWPRRARLGAAWYEREHLGLGVPFPPLKERYERLDETIRICFQMWSPDNSAFEGVHYRLAETLCSPQPVSSPRPRLLIGGGGERKTLRLVAQYADACNIIGDASTVADKVGVLERHCNDVGRDPAEIEVTALTTVTEDATVDAILGEAEALRRGRGTNRRGTRCGSRALPLARGDLGPRRTKAG